MSYSRSVERTLNAAVQSPDVSCVLCGLNMTRKMNGTHLAGYSCVAHGCLGMYVTVEELCDSQNWAAVQDEAWQRYYARERMRIRNGYHTVRRVPDIWCRECNGYHEPTEEHPCCRLCMVGHQAVPADVKLAFRGWLFTAPFVCFSCGIEICCHQWRYSRICAACDTVQTPMGRRVPNGYVFAGPHTMLPTWSTAEGDLPGYTLLDPKLVINPRNPQRMVGG